MTRKKTRKYKLVYKKWGKIGPPGSAKRRAWMKHVRAVSKRLR